MEQSSDQIIESQEAEYSYPYHYIGRMPQNGFSQHLVHTWAINYVSTIEFLLNKISEDNPASLIDIGCGDGRLPREIHLRFPETKVCGIDYSARAITLAKAMNQDLPCIDFKHASITETNSLAEYDCAVLMEVFEHIPVNKAECFIESVRRTIKPGGYLLLTVPHSNKPVEYKHFQHFTTDSITRYLKPYFSISEVVPFEKGGFVRKVMCWLLCNRLFVLNNHHLLNFIYQFHRRFLFFCTREEQCQRLFVKAIAK